MPDLGKVSFVQRHLTALLLCLLVAPPTLAQSEGDVMQIYQRAEQQVEKLNQMVPAAEKQMVAVNVAISQFRNAETREEITAAMQKSLAAFQRNERSLENLSRALQEVGESMRGLGPIAESAEGAAQLESVENALAVADEQLSVLASAGGNLPSAGATQQQLNLVRGTLQSQRQEALRKQADEHRDRANNAKTNLERTGEILSRLSAQVDVIKINNDVNRELVVALALRNMPANEAKESLERIMGQFQTPVDMGKRVDTLLTGMEEATAELIDSLWSAGATGLPDFSEADIEAYFEWEERLVERSCEECTDGLDNDLDGKTDAEQSRMCKNFVQRDPTCTMSNRY